MFEGVILKKNKNSVEVEEREKKFFDDII